MEKVLRIAGQRLPQPSFFLWNVISPPSSILKLSYTSSFTYISIVLRYTATATSLGQRSSLVTCHFISPVGFWWGFVLGDTTTTVIVNATYSSQMNSPRDSSNGG